MMKENNEGLDRATKESKASKEQQWIDAEQAKTLYAQGRLSMLGTILFSTILVIGLRTVIPHQSLIIWFCLIMLLTAMRYLLLLAFRMKSDRYLRSRRWVDLFALGQLLNGIIWGASFIWLFPEKSALHQALIVLLILGMVAAGLQAYSNVLRVFLAFTVPVMIPLIFRLFITGGNIHATLAVSGIFFTIFVIVTARRLGHIAVSGRRLQFENRELIAFLTVEKERAERLNKDLETRIIEKEQAETALRGSEERYRTVFENTGTATIMVDEDSTISMINSECEKLTGYFKQEVEGKLRWTDFVAEGDLERLKEYGRRRRVNGAGATTEYEFRLIDKLGKMKQIWAKVALMPNTDKSVASLMDVTERKRAEEALRESEERLRSVMEAAPDPVVIYDMEGRVSYLNPAFTNVFGWTLEESLGKKTDFVPEENLPETINAIERMLLGETIQSLETRRLTKDGRLLDIEISSSTFFDHEGKPEGSVVILRDVTERERMAASLRESEERFRGLVEESPLGVTLNRADGQYAYFNPSFVKMFGYTMEEIPTGREWFRKAYPDPEYRKQVVSAWKSYLGKINLGASTPQTFEVICKDGSQKTVLFRPVALENGRQLVISEDITERKQMIEALRQAKEEAESASRAKTDFLASMSHEIRTPMNAIIGMADLLKETSLTTEQQQYVQIFGSAGENLLSIINDILDISKVEAGHLDLEAIHFDLNELTDTACDVLAFRAHERGLELTCNVKPDVPTDLIGDPVRLRQIIVNLIGNAIKFTEDGEVRLEVQKQRDRPRDRTGGDVEILFSVSDTGLGIPKEKTDVIFDSFRQADSTITRKHGGTGLGLAISKKLVELMQGHIWAESELGQGSTFYFTAKFPVQTEPVEVVKHVPVDLKGLKALVVDDNTTNRIILREMLSERGALVSEAESGEKAIIEIKKAAESRDLFRLVLLDAIMPDIDGFHVVKRLLKQSDLAGMIIMMLTSDRRSKDIARCKQLGIASYLVKPVKRVELLEAIANALGTVETVTERGAAAEPAALEALPPLHILLVEDNEDNVLLIKAFLRKTPCEVAFAENGEIAVEKFALGKYDLVLMDMQMPVMDGYTATKKIRKWEKEQEAEATPIVALTAYATREETQKSIDAGCNAHLSKPIKKAKLLRAIQEYTDQKSGRL